MIFELIIIRYDHSKKNFLAKMSDDNMNLEQLNVSVLLSFFTFFLLFFFDFILLIQRRWASISLNS